VPDPLSPYLAEAESYIRHAKAADTVKAYESDWASFETFCKGREVASLPAALYRRRLRSLDRPSPEGHRHLPEEKTRFGI
jgi:hypothetical protein